MKKLTKLKMADLQCVDFAWKKNNSGYLTTFIKQKLISLKDKRHRVRFSSAFSSFCNTDGPRAVLQPVILEWFSNTTGTSFDDAARSKNIRKELGRLRRRVFTESWFSKEVQGECPCSATIYSLFFHFSEAVICCYLITSQVKKAKFKWKTHTLLVCYQSTASEK